MSKRREKGRERGVRDREKQSRRNNKGKIESEIVRESEKGGR